MRTVFFKTTRSMIYLAMALVAVLPFNDLPFFENVLREMGVEGAFYISVPLLILFFVHNYRNIFKNLSVADYFLRGIVLFIVLVIISGLVNFNEIKESAFFDKTGISKFLLQLCVLGYACMVGLVFYGVALNVEDLIQKLAVVLQWALLFTLLFGLFEFLVWYSESVQAMAMLKKVESFFHRNLKGAIQIGRIRSVSGEPSWLAMYLGFAAPFIFLVTFKTRQLTYFVQALLTLGVLAAILLSRSKAGYAITVAQLGTLGLMALLYLYYSGARRWFYYLSGATGAAFLAFVVLLFTVQVKGKPVYQLLINKYSPNVETTINVSRYAMQIAAFRMGLDRPVTGYGLGQFAFHYAPYLPRWAVDNYEIKHSQNTGTWPPVHGIYARLAGETGFIVMFLWLSAWLFLLVKLLALYKQSSQYSQLNKRALVLILCVISCMLTGFTHDSFRFFGFWITLGLGFAFINKKNETIAEAQNIKASP